MKHCFVCGNKERDGAKFCSVCGSRFYEDENEDDEASAPEEETYEDAFSYAQAQARKPRVILIGIVLIIIVLCYGAISSGASHNANSSTSSYSGSSSTSKSSTSSSGTGVSEEDAKWAVYLMAEEQIPNYIKCPSTMEMCLFRDCTIKDVGHNIWKGEGYFDAENLYGANVRSKWNITCTIKDGTIHFSKLKIDDIVVYSDGTQ